MPWEPQAATQPPAGWWVEHEFRQWVAGVAAEIRAKRQAEEDAKRLRELRRRVERIDEAIVLAQGAAEARRLTYERSGRSRGEVEHSAPLGRVLRVR
jgi:hypothetical protein